MSIFDSAMAALASGPLGETVTWRPRVGPAFTVHVMAAQTGDMQVDGRMLVPELVYDCLAADFDNEPLERDKVMFGSTVRAVKSVERVNDGLFYRCVMEATR